MRTNELRFTISGIEGFRHCGFGNCELGKQRAEALQVQLPLLELTNIGGTLKGGREIDCDNSRKEGKIFNNNFVSES